VSDTHGDCQDDGAVKAMLEFKKYFKPEIRIHAGDAFDFRPLRKKATDEERREGKSLDVEMGLNFIDAYRPTHFLRGNHDERLWDLFKSDDGQKREAAIATAESIMQRLQNVGCEHVLPYHKRLGVLNIGKLRVVHGYAAGVNAAKKHCEVYGAVLFGHVHRIEQYSIPTLERNIGRCIGCLCQLDMDYNRAQLNTLSQEHGFAYGFLDSNGLYTFYQAMPLNGRWFFPSEWTSR
jgi:predicted phosphodiesterase